MTLKQLIKLAKKGRKWGLRDGLEIRCSDGLCPIIAAYCNKFPTEKVPRSWLYDIAAKDLGLDPQLAETIASSADASKTDSYSHAVRRELLEGLGLV